LSFASGDSAENIITADATFRFSYFNYERIWVTHSSST
jgi:hypothetical protein